MQEEEAFRSFITEKHADDFEVSEGWYRWTYQVKTLDVEYIQQVLSSRYQANEKLVLTLEEGEYVSRPIEKFGAVKDMYIAARGVGGVADELIIETDKQTYKVITEHNIRYVLNNGKSKILRQDGSEVSSPSILPSAFCHRYWQRKGKCGRIYLNWWRFRSWCGHEPERCESHGTEWIYRREYSTVFLSRLHGGKYI